MTGYVGIAEKMPLGLLPEFMNRYFEVNCATIEEHGGCVDGFTGDRITAFWGIDQTAQESATLACESALEMVGMAAFYDWAGERGHPCPRIRIGIATGPVTMGELGSERRPRFTLMGECLNTAAALEDAARQCDSGILVDENTHRHVTSMVFGSLVNVARGDSVLRAYPLAPGVGNP